MTISALSCTIDVFKRRKRFSCQFWRPDYDAYLKMMKCRCDSIYAIGAVDQCTPTREDLSPTKVILGVFSMNRTLFFNDASALGANLHVYAAIP